jgi:hypothetical protein
MPTAMASAPKKASTSWSECLHALRRNDVCLTLVDMTVSSSLASKALDVFGGGPGHRKLRFFRSIFPHDDNTSIPDVLDVYADALKCLRFVLIQTLLFTRGVIS